MADPRYVRLRQELTGSVLVDTESGWNISGLHVLPFPNAAEWPRANAYVKSKLTLGLLESASEEEYKVVQQGHEEVAKVAANSVGGIQEGQIQQAALHQTRRILRTRVGLSPDPEAPKPTASDQRGVRGPQGNR